MSDELFGGRRIRLLTLVDNFTRESLAIEVAMSIGWQRGVETLRPISEERGLPQTIRVDNGPEFRPRILDLWAYLNGVELDSGRPGKPTDNAFVESFNGSFRDECLNVNWVLSIEDAREKIGAWRRDYNEWRPHGSLDNLSLRQYLDGQAQRSPDSLLLAGPVLG